MKSKQLINEESAITLAIIVAIIIYWILGQNGFYNEANILLVSVTILGSMPLFFDIFRSIIKGNFGVDLIASLAIITSISVHEYLASSIILLMLSGGKSLERYAENRARNSLSKLLAQSPKIAHKYIDGKIVDIEVQEIKVGDTFLVKANEIIPIDGLVQGGQSTVDESMITGEPMPRDVAPHNKVWSGSINIANPIYIVASTNHEQSVFQAIIRLVKEAEENKSPLVRLADRYSVVFTFITILIATIASLRDPRLASAVLVVATPCPLILAAPIAFIAGMSRSAKRGIVVKHGGVFELITDAKVFLFDKTGTLTFGIPQLEKVIVRSAKFKELDVLKTAASIEQFSTHILARSIVNKAKEENLTLIEPENIKETLGKGVCGEIGGVTYFIGKEAYLNQNNIDTESVLESSKSARAEGNVMIHIATKDEVVASIVFSDTIRTNTKEALGAIKGKGAKLVLVTGDSNARANTIGKELGFTDIKSDCLPEDKVKIVNEFESKKIKSIMIGDGVNDAPALKAASVGIALGHHGETASTDTADAIILVDDLNKVSELISISHKTMRIAKESVLTGMGLSIVAMVVASAGYLPPIYGALLQEGIDVLVILNALRALKD